MVKPPSIYRVGGSSELKGLQVFGGRAWGGRAHYIWLSSIRHSLVCVATRFDNQGNQGHDVFGPLGCWLREVEVGFQLVRTGLTSTR